MMEKKNTVHVTVRIPVKMPPRVTVMEPTIVKDSESKWDQLEKHARNCPIAHFSSGYIFLNEIRDYFYSEMSKEDAEKVRIYWTDKFDDVEVVVFPWEPGDEYPMVFNPDDIPIQDMK